MSMPMSLVIATKDRPADLRRLLASLKTQAVRPDEVVIVDGGAENGGEVVSEFPELRLIYLRHWPPSAAAQRNAGVKACSLDASLIGFVDDDAVFEPGAVEQMMKFWESAGGDVLGASFNLRNYSLPAGRDSRGACWLAG